MIALLSKYKKKGCCTFGEGMILTENDTKESLNSNNKKEMHVGVEAIKSNETFNPLMEVEMKKGGAFLMEMPESKPMESTPTSFSEALEVKDGEIEDEMESGNYYLFFIVQ